MHARSLPGRLSLSDRAGHRSGRGDTSTPRDRYGGAGSDFARDVERLSVSDATIVHPVALEVNLVDHRMTINGEVDLLVQQRVARGPDDSVTESRRRGQGSPRYA